MSELRVGMRVVVRHPNRIYPGLPGHYGHILLIEDDPLKPLKHVLSVEDEPPTRLVWVDITGHVSGKPDLVFTQVWNGARGWPCWETDLEVVD